VPFEVRPVAAEELEGFVWALEIAAGRSLSELAMKEARTAYEPARTVAAFEDGRIVGGTASNRLHLTLPGLTSAVAARITLTAVLPTHRQRGLATALMRQQVGDLSERGEPLAIFTTSSAGIYHRFGYSPASFAMGIETETSYRPVEDRLRRGTLRMLDPREYGTIFPEVFERHRLVQPGQVSRAASFWNIWLEDHDFYRAEGQSERFGVVYLDESSTAQGYLTYRLERGELREQPVRSLVVEDLVCVSAEARRALWGYCLEFRQALTVKAPNIPIDDPIAWILIDPRSVRVTRMRDFLWLRLVDVSAALGARRYSVDGSIVFQVLDDVVPRNSGRHRLDGGPDGAECVRTSQAPDLELSVRDLAAAYLGGVSFSTLARAGRVHERMPCALAKADALFGSRPAAWTVTDW
jgi:predicted acetyltransferase